MAFPVVPPDISYLDELKQLFQLHARAQGIPARRCAQLLARITEESGPGPHAWAQVWSRAAAARAARGDHLGACRYYNAARFPFVDGAPREQALARCVEELRLWGGPRGIEQITVPLDGARLRVWTSSPDPRRPLLVVLGGIVSIKEQWAQLLPTARRLGMTVAVTEMPGVGENSLTYSRDSWRMLPALLDRLADRADVSRTSLLALSFSGHLALRAAGHDSRIRGIATVGPPVTEFFRDREWWNTVPRTTKRTLCHLTGAAPEELFDTMADWALDDTELARITIPVHTVASRRDEIIPPGDVLRLRTRLPRAQVLEHDDVHGSPHHMAATKLWMARSLLLMGGDTGLRPKALGAAVSALSAVARVRGRVG
ncbi:alpha/beta fold hydrolase [Streptomyces sp. G5(2025)]|uniref:alpha/beta fold hydrolase n=1 Tax=Streptomyces sp. G5(2025) TaxID=3406628 RepID=UPI003C1634B2